MDVTIREADPADLLALARLRRRWTDEDRDEPVADDGFEQRFTAWYEGPAGERIAWLAEADREPIGMLNLLVFHRMPRPGRADSRWGYVSNVFVTQEWRDRGVGAELLDAAVARARREGFVRVVLSPSPRSVPFYLRAGFGPATELLVMNL